MDRRHDETHPNACAQNAFGQTIGPAVPDWEGVAPPARAPIAGRFCRLEPLDEVHGDALFEAYALDSEGRNWTYLSVGPFFDREPFDRWLAKAVGSDDPLFFAVIDARSQRAVGVASYLRIDPDNGVIEIGHIGFSPLMQATVVSSEALYLLMRQALGNLGYRRLEWKCDSLNTPSRRAARRLGFQFDGLFRQMQVYKGRNRDTAWYSILDSEWPAIDTAFNAWFDHSNMSSDGRQREPLSRFMNAAMSGLQRDLHDADQPPMEESRTTP